MTTRSPFPIPSPWRRPLTDSFPFSRILFPSFAYDMGKRARRDRVGEDRRGDIDDLIFGNEREISER